LNKSIAISVVIPTFNRASLLPRALDSVLAQTFMPTEIIVVDDGSTDTTRQLMKDRYPGIDYLYLANKGVSHARNAGVARSNCRWLAFLDSDDQWLPDKLERQWHALQAEPHYRLCHTDEIWIRNGKRVNPMNKHAKQGGYIFEKCLPLCVISPSSVVLCRQLFERLGGFDETLPACEDYDLWLRICASRPVLYLDEPLLRKYGGHPDQLSRQHWGMDRFRVHALEKLLKSGVLSSVQYSAARRILLQKCEILTGGAMKRGKSERANYFRKLAATYRVNQPDPLQVAREADHAQY